MSAASCDEKKYPIDDGDGRGRRATILITCNGSLTVADGYLFGALLVCAAGDTEGGRLARIAFDAPGNYTVTARLYFGNNEVARDSVNITARPLR